MSISGETYAGSIEAESQAEERLLRSINGVPKSLGITLLKGQCAECKHRTDQVHRSPFFRRAVADVQRVLVESLFAVKLIDAVERIAMENRNEGMDTFKVGIEASVCQIDVVTSQFTRAKTLKNFSPSDFVAFLD